MRKKIMMLMYLALTAGVAFAGPPLTSDDTGTVEPGMVELEFNGSYSQNRAKEAGVVIKASAVSGELKLATGLAKELSAAITAPYLFSSWGCEGDVHVEKIHGLSDITVELKYRFMEKGATSLAIKPYLLIPSGEESDGLSDGRAGGGGQLIASSEFADGKYTLHANLGYEYHNYKLDAAANRRSFYSGSLAAEGEFSAGLKGVIDFGLCSAAARGDNTPAAYLLLGGSYALTDQIGLNAGVKLGLTKNEDDLGLLYGLTYSF